MNYEIIKELENEQLKKEVPQFNVGDTVRVHNRIKEGNRERIQIFEGTVLKIQGGGPRTTFTVRKESSGIGVEKTWPLHSPNVEKVDVVRRGKVRRAKLSEAQLPSQPERQESQGKGSERPLITETSLKRDLKVCRAVNTVRHS